MRRGHDFEAERDEHLASLAIRGETLRNGVADAGGEDSHAFHRRVR